MSMDLMTDLPATADGHDSIVVFCCRLTKMLHFVPCCKTVTAPQLASLFIQHVFRALVCLKTLLVIVTQGLLPTFGKQSLPCLVPP